jgi:hypothetical protein
MASLGILLLGAAAAAPATYQDVEGCAFWCGLRNTNWYTECASTSPKKESAECVACLACPDLRSPQSTTHKTRTPPPHGAMIEGGTDDERIGLMLRDRNPCYLSFWSGWVEVEHHIPYRGDTFDALEETTLWMWPAAPTHSGLWFPPGRVLVCDDALDLYIYLNETEEVARLASIQEENAAAPAGSQPALMTPRQYPHKKAIFDNAAKTLAGEVDTLVFLNHADYNHGERRALYTELVLLPASHTYQPFGCPVSSAFRVETSFTPSAQFLKDNRQGEHWGPIHWWPNMSAHSYDGSKKPMDRSERLFLAECSCTFSRIC